jgi:predicted RNase H-like nuclease (RuvC/YqgF family)
VSTFNSLSYATRLVDAGVPRDQAEVHALVLQSVYDEEHKQYATKADFLELRQEVKQQILHLEMKTDRIEAKTDQLEIKTDRIEAKTDQLELKTDRIEAKMNQIEAKTNQIEVKLTEVEVKLSAEISGLTKTVNECKEEFLRFRSDVSVLRTSHKYIVWIGGGVATMCLSVIALCIPIFLHTLK